MTSEKNFFSILTRPANSLSFRLILSVGLILGVSISIWAGFNIRYQKKMMMESAVLEVDRLSKTILQGTHYAMMLNSREDIHQIVRNIGKHEEIDHVRIYNKEGRIKFSNISREVDRLTNIKDDACVVCHTTEPPLSAIPLDARTRIIGENTENRKMGIISPIYNEPVCAGEPCHVHPGNKKVLGALDLVISLKDMDSEMVRYHENIVFHGVLLVLLVSAFMYAFFFRFVNRPIHKIISATRRIAKGDYGYRVDIRRKDEIGQLADSINRMSREIGVKQMELNNQKNEYENLFNRVPCIITVQDRNYRLVGYNREFSRKFDPKPGDYCFYAYKGRQEKCPECPVEKTFADGQHHYSEESGVNREGGRSHWIVRTSPIKNAEGQIVAAMEMCLDVTQSKLLEEKLKASEKKYYAIFNNIANPVFVLDEKELTILDCNSSVTTVYGYTKNEMINRSFLDLFAEADKAQIKRRIRCETEMNRLKHVDKNGNMLFVDMLNSPSEYAGKKALLVTTSDITRRLEAEMQLTHAGKMATLGEMATGMAHELNQPLTVIKTASSLLMRKVRSEKPAENEILVNISGKIDKNVDRATRIINHMRQFARKTELTLEPVDVNTVLENAMEIFARQLELRGIEVCWELADSLPQIMGDAGRLEQVFVNMFVNARDAIEEKAESEISGQGKKEISIRSFRENGQVVVAACKQCTLMLANSVFLCSHYLTTAETPYPHYSPTCSH